MSKSCSEWKNSNRGDNNYRVYLHVFPDGKRYVGSTKRGLKQRWNGGFGYEQQNLMFDAICKYGWNNIRHYLLFDGLDKKTALLIEASLIKKWKTYRISGGYNARLPKIQGMDTFVVPKYKRIQIFDVREYSEKDRFNKRSWKRERGIAAGGGRPLAIAVYCPEFDELFNSVSEASAATQVSVSSICNCIYGRQKTAGTHFYTGERLHWERVDKQN